VDIFVLDTEFRPVSIIDVYESLIWTDRYDEYGDFELYISMSPDPLTLYNKFRFLRNP
jgi:hypothetical protein